MSTAAARDAQGPEGSESSEGSGSTEGSGPRARGASSASLSVGTEVPSRVPWIGFWAAVALVLVATFGPDLIGWQVYARSDPDGTPGSLTPIHSIWEPKLFGIGTIPAFLLGFLGYRYAVDLAARLPWRRLLLASYGASLVWLFSLALVSGWGGVGDKLEHSYEYLETARGITDVPAFLSEFVSRIPIDSVDAAGQSDNWVTHVAGHPPGATLMFVVLARLGLANGFVAGSIVILVAASLVVALLVTLRTLGAEPAARRVAPFLVFIPAAIWMGVSADAVFATTAAWGMAALATAAVATTRGRLIGFGVVAGLLLGWCMMLSYGLPLLGVLALAVLLAARSWRPLPIAFVSALVPVLAFVPFGFRWWEAYPVLTDRYWDGLASRRPGLYWTWGDLALVLYSGGLLVGAGVAVLGWRLLQERRAAKAGAAATASSSPGPGDVAEARSDRTLLILSSAGALMILLATSSQMSRAEVERIWLPFIPWVVLSLALLPERWRRIGLAVPIVSALLLEQLVYHSW